MRAEESRGRTRRFDKTASRIEMNGEAVIDSVFFRYSTSVI